MSSSIAFIGGGNMASSLIGGLRESGTAADTILVSEPDDDRRQSLMQQFGIQTTLSNTDCLQQDMVVLAVKPQLLKQVCEQLQPNLDNTPPTFISIAAGLRSMDINQWLGGTADNKLPIVRCMPNTPALLQCGATGMYANAAVSQTAREQADNILNSVGITVWVDDENLLDSITAVSGSGPAYYFLMMEAMQQAAIEMGLDTNTASKLVTQTALGAARMMAESDLDAATLRANVTSKGGTTEQAILSFEQSGFRDTVKQALKCAYNRSVALADELGKP